MEKKVIDLMDCNEETTIYLPKGYEKLMATKDDSGMIDTIILTPKEPDPFGLVPNSWEEFCENNPFYNKPSEYFINTSSVINERNKVCNYRSKECDKNIHATREDAEAFLALIQLRRLWHEWVRILGKPSLGQINYYITYNEATNEIDIENCLEINGLLVFDEQFHAEKFIECFKELLDKAKILL